MSCKRRPRPTMKILDFAQSQPGGVIRWKEARDIYLKESPAAQRNEATANRKALRGSKNGNRQYHIALAQVLKTHFAKVEGTDGFYVMKHMIVGEP